jgi:hypothetical protein
VLKSHVGRGSFPQRLKPPFENKVFIAAVNRCATQKARTKASFSANWPTTVEFALSAMASDSARIRVHGWRS